MAEKQRRDNLNTNISTMASLVPIIVGCPRRLDKISILRLATSYLRMDYTLGRGSANFLPKQFKDLDVEQYILDVSCNDSIFVVFSSGTSTNNDIIFVGVAWFPKKRPITELSITDANKEEYVTRHLVDGRIIYCDHRISIVAGYMSEEVSGMSAFKYMHKDDVRWTIIGLRQMYDRAEPCGSSCYRLLSKTGQFIYLRTHGYLEYDKDTQSVESFVCINTLVSEEEGIEFVREMKERFSATVSGFTKAAAMIQNTEDISFNLRGLDSKKSNSDASLEDASQLEDAITHLISDLPSPTISEDRLSPKPISNSQFAKAAIFSQRLPPVATQTSKIRLKKIDHCTPTFNDDNKCSNNNPVVKQEPSNGMKEEHQTLTSTKTIADSIVEKEIISDEQQQQRRVGRRKTPLFCNEMCTEKPITLRGMMRRAKALEQKYRNKDMKPLSLLERDSSKTTSVMKNNNEKTNNSLESLENDTGESETDVSKRKYNEDNVGSGDTTLRSKKRKNKKKYEIVCEVQHEQQQQQQEQEEQQQLQPEEHSVSYVHCRTFINNELFTRVDEFDTYDQEADTQPVQIISMDSPNSSIQDCNIKYPKLLDSSMPLEIPNMVDLNERVNDISLEDIHALNHIRTYQGRKTIQEEYSTIMEHTPDFMLKIFNNLRPVMGFEKNYDEVNSRQLSSVNDQQMVNDELTRTHLQLANCITIQESQFDVLARNLENPVLQSQRKNLTQLQAEHKMQKQMLKTLQQEHLNVQVNTKQNVGV
ncbi:PREDICTED: uncharacterized protein LOC106791735 [Polistes canadensis]|uniref:uncharacterized protein LOC106791735 n=1 Tax=Polistes canadensis TaxID=91411 RepID=UPI000718FC6B|nr:PREDICTED: uncharacterized protein LOC106791735 [Polistes canadensis]